MSEAKLITGGQAYLGWTDIEVVRSLEQLAPTFSVSYAELWSGQNQAIPIIEGETCIIELDGLTAITGYVDQAQNAYDATTHELTVSGSGKTVDLVDCSAIYQRGHGQWLGQPLQQIAVDLCQPFGITVSVQTSLGNPFSKFTIQDGETVYEALERACRMRGVIMMTSPAGELVFIKPAVRRTRTVIERGVNVLRGERKGNWRERFSKYICKGQAAADASINSVFGIQSLVTSPKKTSLDTEVTRYRPLVIMAESFNATTGGVGTKGATSTHALQLRADWERNVRAGRSQRLAYTLDGWQCAEGLWEPNTLVRVKDDVLRVDAEVLIISVRYTKGAGGATVDLELADPSTVAPQPLTPRSTNPLGGFP